MPTPAQEAVLKYARQAFSIVLDQHEVIIPPSEIRATMRGSDTYIDLLYEILQISASGQFVGDAQSGILTLEWVKTPARKELFNSVHQFRGVRDNGTPILLPPI